MQDPIEKTCLEEFRAASPAGFAVVINLQPTAREFDWVHVEYPEPWTEHYVENEFISQDPTILFAEHSTGHVTWAELEQQYPGNQVLTEMKDFGITEGNTLCMMINGSRSLVSGVGPAWSAAALHRLKIALTALHNLHVEVSPTVLTPKVLEVIRLMADGHRDAEIADTLGIKVETVRNRRNMAYDQTGTKTPAHLIAQAIRSGLI